MPINPYQAAWPVARVDPQCDRLIFDGVIVASDYQKMLPRGDREWWLYAVLAMVLGICTAFFGSVGVAAIAFGEPLVGLGFIAFCSLLGFGLWFAKRRISSVDRTSRRLKKNPDLLGIAQGEFSNSGLLFFDGLRHYWFGPRSLLNTNVSKAGIRVRVDGDPYRYLALADRLFDPYSVQVARQLKQGWITLTTATTDEECLQNQDGWQRLSDPPNDAIPFQGHVMMEQATRTRESAQVAVIELASSLILIGLAIAFGTYSKPWILWSGAIYGVIGLGFNVKRWHHHFRGTLQHSWYQRGWINSQEVAICCNDVGVRMPVSQFTSRQCTDNLVVLMTARGGAYYVARDHVSDAARWNQLCALQQVPEPAR